MAEPIPYHALSIPRPGLTLEEIEPQLEAVRRLELPGIIISDVGSDVGMAMDILGPILSACGVTIHRREPLLENIAGRDDLPLHVDSIPLSHPSTGMVVQYTGKGSADIVLAKLADPFCEELSQRNADMPPDDHTHGDFDLPPGTEALFDKGLVDPEVLRPEIYVGSVAAGGVTAFTFGGPNPIAHRFRTTAPERHFQGHLASFIQL